jgi:hypothetical protein
VLVFIRKQRIKFVIFYSGLHNEIQVIVDYEEYNIVNRLF